MDKNSLYIGRLVKVEENLRKYSKLTYFKKKTNGYKDLLYGRVYNIVSNEFCGSTIGVDHDTLEPVQLRRNVSKRYVKTLLGGR